MKYSVLPYDVLARNFKNVGIRLTDEMFFAILEYTEQDHVSGLLDSVLLGLIYEQGIDVKDWRCGMLDQCPLYLGVITPNCYIALCSSQSPK